MTKEFAQFLVKAAEHCGTVEDIQIRESYSGRGMYGQETCAVIVSSYTGGMGELLLNVVQYIKEKIEDMSLRELENSTDFIPDISDLKTLQTDSMGHGMVIY
jgi:trehalose-6-phosphate synthase